jgi:hypothetical protein
MPLSNPIFPPITAVPAAVTPVEGDSFSVLGNLSFIMMILLRTHDRPDDFGLGFIAITDYTRGLRDSCYCRGMIMPVFGNLDWIFG